MEIQDFPICRMALIADLDGNTIASDLRNFDLKGALPGCGLRNYKRVAPPELRHLRAFISATDR